MNSTPIFLHAAFSCPLLNRVYRDHPGKPSLHLEAVLEKHDFEVNHACLWPTLELHGSFAKGY